MRRKQNSPPVEIKPYHCPYCGYDISWLIPSFDTNPLIDYILLAWPHVGQGKDSCEHNSFNVKHSSAVDR
jgi:hypothetical protein